MTTTDEQDLTRAVASDLGPAVLAAVDNPQPEDATRVLGIAEAAAVAGLLVQCVQMTIQIWQARQDRALLVEALADSDRLMDMYPRLDPEKRLGIIARVLARFLPNDFGPPAHDHGAAAEKRKWVSAYAASRGAPDGMATRDFQGGALLLMPFADQDWWIVWQPVGWIPSEADGPGLERVDVPRGFVTDLASVPGYLWVVLQKTGRYGNAAIYHDWLYWQQSVPRAQADRVFDRAMHDMGVDAATRRLMWAGVRVFGGSYWEANRTARAAGEKRLLSKFPDSPTITWSDWRQRPGVFT